MNKILKLHPHKHTGKLLHHRHTSYPALFLILALAGGAMLTPIGMARADSYAVSAIVPAPLPSDPAVITQPANNTTVPGPNVTITGSCPIIDPPIIIVLYDGSSIAGSAYCTADGSFSIPISLTPGSHSIVPRVINFTGQYGASGTPILVTYSASLEPTKISKTVTTTVTTTTPKTTQTNVDENYPIIIADSSFITFGPHKDAVWKASLRSGTTPYGITMNWGDGTIQNQHGVAEGSITLRHRYKLQKMYPLRFEVRDAVGHVIGITSVAVSPAAYANYTDQPTTSGTTMLHQDWLIYSLYIVTVVGLTMVWHHERQHVAFQPVRVATKPIRRSTTARKRR